MLSRGRPLSTYPSYLRRYRRPMIRVVALCADPQERSVLVQCRGVDMTITDDPTTFLLLCARSPRPLIPVVVLYNDGVGYGSQLMRLGAARFVESPLVR